jgi:hypothetical protein
VGFLIAPETRKGHSSAFFQKVFRRLMNYLSPALTKAIANPSGIVAWSEFSWAVSLNPQIMTGLCVTSLQVEGPRLTHVGPHS